MSLTKNPKDGPIWKSAEYRRFIRDHQDCFFCGCSLLDEKPTYESHHAFHEGGKKPRDQFLVPMCRRCHSEFHMNESRFNAKYGLDQSGWLDNCIHALRDYVESKNVDARFVILNALTQIAMEES